MLNSFLSRVPLLYRALFPGARWRIPALEGRSVYLTFDDGPIPEITPWVLEVLRAYNIKATFFCVGDNIAKHPELFEQIKREGHQVGNHTQHHPKALNLSTKAYMRDVLEAHKLIGSRYFRPPYGHLRWGQTREISHSFEMIMWDVLTRDYNHKLSPERVLDNVKRYTRNGSIIVFHDSLKAERNLKYALPRAIEWLLSEGYQFRRIGDAP